MVARNSGVLAVVLVWLGLGCSGGTKPEPEPTLPPLQVFDLAVSEPSGLTIDEQGTTLWTVGGKNIYRLALDGQVLEQINYTGIDLEGIAYDRRNGSLWVVEEGTRELINLATDGSVLARRALDLPGALNSGPEGLCFDDADSLFVVNEKDPTLFVEIASDLTIKERVPLAFAGDYSGLAYNPNEQCFWMLSDQEQRIYLWTKTKGITGSYLLPYRKAEGIAYDATNNLVYVVNDEQNKLYVYRIER